MGKSGGLIGSKQSGLKKSFKLAVRPLLTSCSREDFSKAFNSFSNSEQDFLHRQYIQVITSLHESIEDEFESLCSETQVGNALDTVEQLVEEQCLDPLFSDRSNVADVAHDLSTAKKKEIQDLMAMIQRVEEQNRKMQARLELLKEGKQDVSSMADVFEKERYFFHFIILNISCKLKSGISDYGRDSNGLHDA